MMVKLACYMAELIFPDFKYRWLGKEFETNLPKEIDFRNEAQNAEKIRYLLRDDNRIVVRFIFKYRFPKYLSNLPLQKF
jgi:predicted unusual protein kinase regulating ubiquinone biosynthesis (AarF/ABC1/UbiB family)